MIKKIIVWILVGTMLLSAWEVNTHRAIDRKAIQISSNLGNFLKDIGGSLKGTIFEDRYLTYEEHPAYTYFSYIKDSGDSMHKVGLTFREHHIQNLIEAGTVLEDAVYTGAWTWPGINGRFLNHFYNPQSSEHRLNMGNVIGGMNALQWATLPSIAMGNRYSYPNAIQYFRDAFMLPDKDDRETNKARMFVSLGHIMHLFNDMNSDYIQRNRT